MTTFTANPISITGASLSGTTGAKDRTYTISASTIQSNLTIINLNGRFLHQGAGKDYTISGVVITFLGNVFNANIIDITYYTPSSVTSTNTVYATTLQLARFMDIEGTVPTRETTGSTRQVELIGTGNNSRTVYYLSNPNIIANSYTISAGATTASLSALTETTDYTVDKNLGEITLTNPSGLSAVALLNIYGKYSFANVGVTDTQLQEAINRAIKTIDKSTSNHWASGTDATPDYNQVTNEYRSGKGQWNRNYYLRQFPLPNVTTTLSTDLHIGATGITASSTNGFPSSGTLLIESDKINYTSKDSTHFTGVSNVASTHASGKEVLPIVIETSTSASGATATWTVLQKEKDFDVDRKSGRIHIHDLDTASDANLVMTDLPLRGVTNRFRANYIWGNETIPDDITRLTLMIASNDIAKTAVRRAHVKGINDFNPDTINVDLDEIRSTLEDYRNHRSDGDV